MNIEQKIIELLDGRYDYETTEYFDLDPLDRDNIAKTIVNDFFWKMKLDITHKIFYLEYIQFRLEQLIKEEKYESVDLYKRLETQINLL
jgi:hypothetical protein